MNQLNTIENIDGVYDIITFSPGISAIDILIYLLVGITILTPVIFYLIKHYTSRKSKSIRAIKRAYSDLKTQKITHKRLAYNISEQIQSGLELKQLTKSSSLPVKLNQEQGDWVEFCHRLNTYKYTRSTHIENSKELTQDAIGWIKKWP